MFKIFGQALGNRIALKALEVAANVRVDQFCPVKVSILPASFRQAMSDRVKHEYLNETNGQMSPEDAAAVKLVMLYQLVEQSGRADMLADVDAGLDAFRHRHESQIAPRYSLALMGRSI